MLALLNLNGLLKDNPDLKDITDWTEVFASKYDFEEIEGWISEDEVPIQNQDVQKNLTEEEKLRMQRLADIDKELGRDKEDK